MPRVRSDHPDGRGELPALRDRAALIFERSTDRSLALASLCDGPRSHQRRKYSKATPEPGGMRRRAFLAAVGGACSLAFAGCVLDRDAVGAGTLVVDNDHDRTHTVTVAVSKASHGDEAVPPRPHDAPPPTTTPLWRRDRSFEVPAGERVREPGFVSEPGAFYVEASTETGSSASTWLGLYPAGEDGEQVAESFLLVDVHEDGRLGVSTPVDD